MKKQIARTLGTVKRIQFNRKNNKHENAMFAIYARDG